MRGANVDGRHADELEESPPTVNGPAVSWTPAVSLSRSTTCCPRNASMTYDVCPAGSMVPLGLTANDVFRGTNARMIGGAVTTEGSYVTAKLSHCDTGCWTV